MGTFAHTANAIYNLSIADLGKTNFCFLFLFAERKQKFCVSFLSKQTKVAVFQKFRFAYIYIYILKRQHMYRYIHRWASLLKQQMSITLYRLPTKENKLPFHVSPLTPYW
jgi:hypothetical protein